MATSKRAGFKHLVRLLVLLGCWCVTVPVRTFGGDLQPPGPPAPTMRTLDSLGFDCPTDKANNVTNLMYNFVTNTVGFDTGFSISNTGVDPFGTTPPPCPGGTCECTLSFVQNGMTTVKTTGAIPSGNTYTNLTSTLVPGFQGYMIAACNFPYAVGFAFISDVGARNLAMGYLAQVICSDRNSTAMGSGR
jgi:hypothetical protein